jgi:hypothetical protein
MLFKAQTLVKNWLNAGSKEALTDAIFMGEQVFIDLFIKYNTAIPSSAADEQLFFIGSDILTANRANLAKLSDANFEKFMFMKGNQHRVATMLVEQKQDAKAAKPRIVYLNRLYGFSLLCTEMKRLTQLKFIFQ